MIMKEPIRTVLYEDYQINVYRDEYADSPRDNCDYTSRFWCNHRSYRFGSGDSRIEEIVDDEKHTLTKEFLHDYIYVPVYMYDHSSQTISTHPFSDPWDSGLFGILAESKEEIKKEFGCKIVTKKLRERIIKRLTWEVEEVDDWLTGEVYGYTVTPVGDTETELDSCWGFYGKFDKIEGDIMEYAKEWIDSEVEYQNRIAEEERITAEKESCEFWSGENAA